MTEPVNIGSAQPIRVLIAEDHELTRFGVRFALEKYPQLLLTGEATNGAEVLKHVSLNPPDVILMDIGMPEIDGIEATKTVKATYPNIKVVMLTSKNEDQLVYSALSAGADAYCMKDIKPERLVQVIQMVLEGVIWLDPAIARVVVQGLPQEASSLRQDSNKPSNFPILSIRELTLLKCIAANQGVQDIARTMVLQPDQVNEEIVNVLKKLAVDVLETSPITGALPPSQGILTPMIPQRLTPPNHTMDKNVDMGSNVQPTPPEDPGWALKESIEATQGGRDYRNKLIPREVEILRLLVDGKTVWEISSIFQISPEWVNAHITNITTKMSVPTAEAAAARAKHDNLFHQKIFS